MDISDEVCEAFGKSKLIFFASLIVDGHFFDGVCDIPFKHASNNSIVTVVFEIVFDRVRYLPLEYASDDSIVPAVIEESPF